MRRISVEPATLADVARILAPESARLKMVADNERIAQLEEEVTELRAEVAGLRRTVEELRAQFE